MKHFRRFILFALILGAGVVIWRSVPVTQFRGQDSQALTQHYHAIQAEDINSRPILLYVDDQPVTERDEGNIWMSDELSLMAPAHLVNDIFQCSLSWREDGTVRITRDDRSLLLDPANGMIRQNDAWEETQLRVTETDSEGEVCFSVDYLAACLGYEYSWDGETNTARLVSPARAARTLPESFDLRTKGKVSEVRDQGRWGTCWAFASLAALESSLLPDARWQFSVDHLVMENGFNSGVDEGGDYNMTLAYTTSWAGPVTETEDPYDGQSVSGLSAAVHLQEAIILNEKDYDQIKALLYDYGAVQSAIYSQPDIQALSDYYSEENASYYYPDSMECNHDIVIIGWDDHYPKENFVIEPEGDGAFICKNSWGSDFGEDGYFYISYYDHNIGIYGVAYTGVEPADNYDLLYQSDLLGWTGSIGYSEPAAWFSNVYGAETDNLIKAVGFYATDADTYYDIYLVQDYESVEDMDRRRLVYSGYLKDKGYYTVDLEDALTVEADSRFAVVMRIYTEGSQHPIAIEYASNELTADADISDGESYMSYTGQLWSHMEETSQCNACLKVYADQLE